MTLTEFLLARIAEDDFAEYGCDGAGKYSRCHHMSMRYEHAVEAMRRIVGLFPDPVADGDGWNEAGRQVLELLAEVYADHPDYREEWRP